MKTKYFFFTALATIMLASCSSDGFVGSEDSPDMLQNNAIGFTSGFKAITRATEHVGADAANLLNKHFTVSGFKVSNATDQAASQVFYDYIVNWTANSAGTTESNTSDWEYVGISVAKPSALWKEGTDVKQTIKYWDFSTKYYDFIAYSTGKATPNGYTEDEKSLGDDEVRVSAIDYENKDTKAYTIGGSRVNLAKCYISDMVTVNRLDYQKEVLLSFRSLASKVRMAIYETVPGYSVKDVKFYVDDATSIATGATEKEANLFTAGSDTKDYFHTNGTFTVFFPTTGDKSDPDNNVAHVAFQPETGPMTTQRFGELEYTTAEGYEKVMDGDTEQKIWLGRTMNEASFAQNKDYTIILPNEPGTVLELRIDYTLVSTDGSNEEIHIYGAKAFVPDTYTKWQPNYAYTYIFKISDNTNGWTTNIIPEDGTDPIDPAGLYPITFDAAVIDTEDGKQSTVTTVAAPSITTYQLGHDADREDYKTGDIYVQVMKNGELVKVNNADHPVQAWIVTKEDGNENAISEATVMDALNIRAYAGDDKTTGRNGLTLTKVTTTTDITTIPSADGTGVTVAEGDAALFSPAEAGTYVFTYQDLVNEPMDIFTAVSLTTKPDDWNTEGVWYITNDESTPAKGTTFRAGTYYQKYTNRNIDWGVKVIKVE